MASYKKDIDLLAVMAQKQARVSPLMVLVPIVVFLVLGALIALGIFWYLSTTAVLITERDNLQLYLDSTRVNNFQEEAAALEAQATEMEGQAEEVKGTLYNLSSYPDMYEEQFDIIFTLAGNDVTLSDYIYDRRTGILNFSASSTSVRRMPQFVQGLRDDGHFVDIQYQGYVKEVNAATGAVETRPTTETATTSSNKASEYRYEITCKLVGPNPVLPEVEEEGDTADSAEEGGGE
ncbi:MAG: hypothetical protein LBL27_02890 [Coriobacteriales bacterium]|nr:hypothetical protein [Coriobacteriales bacterium]